MRLVDNDDRITLLPGLEEYRLPAVPSELLSLALADALWAADNG